MGENCSTGCKTKDHESFGQCMRSKNSGVMGLESTGNDLTKQKRWDKELDFYANARKQGIQPASTKHKDIQHAHIMSDLKGEAYQA